MRGQNQAWACAGRGKCAPIQTRPLLQTRFFIQICKGKEMSKAQLKYWGGLTNDEICARAERILKYCEPHMDKMWAATVVGYLLSSDFRDSARWLKEYRELDSILESE